jgi:HK97 family phage major capsid protein|nr:MAG TPA: major capsid protein [Caudoviricetes sp.]
MNRQEYLDKRNALYDKAKRLIAENKLAEAREVTQQIDKLDSEFENSAVNKANKNAEEGIKMPPAPFENHKTNIDLTDEGEQVTDMYATLEYRKAFANYIQNGVPVPQKFMNAASQTTSSTAAAIVPTTMYQRLIVELEKVGEIYARELIRLHSLFLHRTSDRQRAGLTKKRVLTSRKLQLTRLCLQAISLNVRLHFLSL